MQVKDSTDLVGGIRQALLRHLQERREQLLPEHLARRTKRESEQVQSAQLSEAGTHDVVKGFWSDALEGVRRGHRAQEHDPLHVGVLGANVLDLNETPR